MKSTSCQVDASEGTVMHSHKKKQHIRMFCKTSAPLHCSSITNMQTKKTRKRATGPKKKDFHYFLICIFSVSQEDKNVSLVALSSYHKVSIKIKQIYCSGQPMIIPSSYKKIAIYLLKTQKHLITCS